MVEKLGLNELYRVPRLAGVVRFGVSLGCLYSLRKGLYLTDELLHLCWRRYVYHCREFCDMSYPRSILIICC